VSITRCDGVRPTNQISPRSLFLASSTSGRPVIRIEAVMAHCGLALEPASSRLDKQSQVKSNDPVQIIIDPGYLIGRWPG